jgi:hypothetical protein
MMWPRCSPATCELAIGDRVVNYCLYGPEDGIPVISHNGSPGTRWKRPGIVSAIERSGVRMLVHDRPGYGGSTRRAGRRMFLRGRRGFLRQA